MNGREDWPNNNRILPISYQKISLDVAAVDQKQAGPISRSINAQHQSRHRHQVPSALVNVSVSVPLPSLSNDSNWPIGSYERAPSIRSLPMISAGSDKELLNT